MKYHTQNIHEHDAIQTPSHTTPLSPLFLSSPLSSLDTHRRQSRGRKEKSNRGLTAERQPYIKHTKHTLLRHTPHAVSTDTRSGHSHSHARKATVTANRNKSNTKHQAHTTHTRTHTCTRRHSTTQHTYTHAALLPSPGVACVCRLEGLTLVTGLCCSRSHALLPGLPAIPAHPLPRLPSGPASLLAPQLSMPGTFVATAALQSRGAARVSGSHTHTSPGGLEHMLAGPPSPAPASSRSVPRAAVTAAPPRPRHPGLLGGTRAIATRCPRRVVSSPAHSNLPSLPGRRSLTPRALVLLLPAAATRTVVPDHTHHHRPPSL